MFFILPQLLTYFNIPLGGFAAARPARACNRGTVLLLYRPETTPPGPSSSDVPAEKISLARGIYLGATFLTLEAGR